MLSRFLVNCGIKEEAYHPQFTGGNAVRHMVVCAALQAIEDNTRNRVAGPGRRRAND
jgi:hypothetical protein